MFEKKLDIVILGDQGRLSKQTLELCNRWCVCRFVDLSQEDSDRINFTSFLCADLILICLEPTSSIASDTRDVCALILELEKANNMSSVNNIVLRTRIQPGGPIRLGAHMLYEYSLGCVDRFWMLGVHSDSIPHRIKENVEQFLLSAFEAEKLIQKPDLKIVSIKEAEAVWFTRLALIACEQQFFKETSKYLRACSLDERSIVHHVIESFPDNLNVPFFKDDLVDWIEEIENSDSRLLNSLLK